MIKIIVNFKDYCHYTGKYKGAVHSICNLKYSIPEKILVVFHNWLNYDYSFIIKVWRRTKFSRRKYWKIQIFPVSISNWVKRSDKYWEETTKNIFYKLQFINSREFIRSLLSDLVDNFAVGVHKIKYKYGHDNKKWKTCGIRYKDGASCLEYTNVTNVHAAIAITEKCLIKT